MAKQTINIGTSANDGTGSTLREAFDITNDNFTELYDGTGGLLHKIEGANFTGSLLVGHSTTGTLSAAIKNTGVGVLALDALTSGDSNTAIGYNAGSNINSGSYNILIGTQAGDALTSGTRNIAIGNNALTAEDGNGRNVAIGHNALFALNAGTDAYNVAVGYDAGVALTTGIYNTILGGLAGDALTTGNSNIAIGLNALGGEDTGHDSVAIGRSALLSQNYDGSAYNVAIGRDAGRLVDTGIKNTIIGGLAGDNLTTGSNNILIGYDATASAVGVSNEVTIGNSNISTVRIPSDSTLKIGVDGDLQIEHVSSNSFIKNTAVGDLYIENQVDDKDVIFRSDAGNGNLATYFFLDGSKAGQGGGRLFTKFPDNSTIAIGSDPLGDLQIYHDGSNSYVESDGTGDLIIKQNTDDQDIKFMCDDGSGGTEIYINVDGSARATKFVNPTFHNDTVKAKFGNGSDLEIYHDGHSRIENNTGDFVIQTNLDDGDIKFRADDGSGGITEYFRVDGGAEIVVASKEFRFADNVPVKLGTGPDFQMLHNGTTTSFENSTGNLLFTNFADDSDIIFKSDDGSGGATEYFRVDGGAEANIFSKNVGIGTASPEQILHVASVSDQYIAKFSHSTATGYAPGSILLEAGQGDSRGQGIFHYNNVADDSWFTGVPYNVASTKWIVSHKPDTTFSPDVAQLSHAIFTIDSATDNVGIGTASPGYNLHVKKSGSGSAITIEGNTNSGANFSSRLNFSNKDISGNDIDFTIGLKKTNDLVFLGDAAANELIRIEGNTGDVGIGTNSPASRLEVDGGDIEVDDSGSGLILRSPDGTRYRVTVANGGTLSVSAV